MLLIRRLRSTALLLLMMNITLLDRLLVPEEEFAARFALRTGLWLLTGAFFLAGEILPCYEKGLKLRLQMLSGGYELILSTIWGLTAELIGYMIYILLSGGPASLSSPVKSLLLLNAVVAFLVLLGHYLNGFWRICLTSSQLGIGQRILMLFFWWVFPVNLILFVRWCKTVRREIIFEKNAYFLEMTQVENQVCRTRYPVVMVHGIFFRDWQFLNYWGRIPQRLKRCGAVVYYGHQQSSLSVADSAAELKLQLEKILQETGAEKLNIVAHSKGGLDSRYCISKLGMADFVASLTTINTPHRGCKFADVLLERLPDWFVRFVAGRYNSLFHRLGDARPDFLGGVNDLRYSVCQKFNRDVPDAPGVRYQSVMSRMRSRKSAIFPLSVTYLLARKYDGPNDGLVGTYSAVWGNDLGLLEPPSGEGISHGDMIDLTRKNIKGFDVADFYVRLLENLKAEGF